LDIGDHPCGEQIFQGERDGYVYGRTRNPTQALLEERIASLQTVEAGLAAATGMAAISSSLWTLLQAGDPARCRPLRRPSS
jgi:methionine-gamma-lyase